jgi:hypothetical protein
MPEFLSSRTPTQSIGDRAPPWFDRKQSAHIVRIVLTVLIKPKPFNVPVSLTGHESEPVLTLY